MKKSLLFGALSLFLLLACNKEKRYSKRLMKGDSWEVISITIDGSASIFTGDWFITSDVNIYDSVPSTNWVASGQDAIFEWQFQDKGKTFQLNYQYLCNEPSASDLDSLDYFCNDLTGAYSVEYGGTNYMEFLSSNTVGFPNQLVEIKIRRKK